MAAFGTNFNKTLIKLITSSYGKRIRKCRLENGGPFVSASICWATVPACGAPVTKHFWAHNPKLVKYCFVNNKDLIRSPFAHAMGVTLLCHVQNCSPITSQESRLQLKEFSHYINHHLINCFWNRFLTVRIVQVILEVGMVVIIFRLSWIFSQTTYVFPHPPMLCFSLVIYPLCNICNSHVISRAINMFACSKGIPSLFSNAHLVPPEENN